jgi:hypothetical protein
MKLKCLENELLIGNESKSFGFWLIDSMVLGTLRELSHHDKMLKKLKEIYEKFNQPKLTSIMLQPPFPLP